MFKKKQQVPFTITAERWNDLRGQYFDAVQSLQGAYNRMTIARKIMQCFVPNTPDYDSEVENFNKAQHSILCAVGRIDSLRQQLIELRATIPKNENTWHYVNFTKYDIPDGHKQLAIIVS